MTMTPREIVQELSTHIIGQDDAKRSVAIALRNRWRRMQVKPELAEEIMPKNILMIGPTGVGKTEIARRLAKLAGAPFIKVEATKFTEVGYVGRDVESIIRDLAKIAVEQQHAIAVEKVQHLAREAAEEKILEELLPRATATFEAEQPDNKARREFRRRLKAGEMDDEEIEIDVANGSSAVEIFSPPGMEEMTSQLTSMFKNISGARTKKRKLLIKEALKILTEEEARKRVDEQQLTEEAIKNVEQNGIVFIDEIDKVCRRADQGVGGGDVSREGVQRDLLPLVEGSTVNTRYGLIKTDHILFIASGAFHVAKPSDLIAELQGRLPIRVELEALSADDFESILTEPKASLTEQYSALMQTEGLELTYEKSGIRRIAEVAFQVNERTENIGARRLYTVMERLLDVISFEATDRSGETVTVDKAYVDKYLGALIEDDDLTRYIL